MSEYIEFHINGKLYQIEASADTPLLHLLRNEFSLFGAKYACGLEQCGACKVIIDGKALPSCKIPVLEVLGKEIRTVESFSAQDALHAVQQAMMEEQALQCGFCTPGFVTAAAALLEKNPQPTDEEIKQALKYHLCRCGVQPRVLRAVKRAAGTRAAPASFSVQDRPLDDLDATQETLPSSFERSPELDQWLQIHPDGTISLFAGKVEYGQGILTALAQIAAEELDVNLVRMRVIPAETEITPDEGMTVGSMSLQTTGTAVRFASAEARQALLSVAIEELEAHYSDLVVEDGTVTDKMSGRSTNYWDLMGGKQFGRNVTDLAPQKSPRDYQLLRQPHPRLDLEKKVTGQPVFLQDLVLPGMLHGRVLRPPQPGAKLSAVDRVAILSIDGVLEVVQDGDFLGIIAESEIQVEKALEEMTAYVTWKPGPPLPGSENSAEYLRSLPAHSSWVVDGTPVEETVPEYEVPAEAVQNLTAVYNRPFQMHASLGPSASIAKMEDNRLQLWAHSQGVYPIRRYIAHVLQIDESDIHVTHVEGPGCYGHNGSDDAALDAALLARAYPDVPISLKWSRADEHRWEPYTPAMSICLQGGLDAAGKIVGWDHQVWSYPHMGRSLEPGHSGLLAAWYLEQPFAPPPARPSTWPHSGGYRNADPLYDFENKRVVDHFVAKRPLRTSSMRGLGAFANVFAIECFMDELALAAGKDPLVFRLEHLQDPRGREVLQAAADIAGWKIDAQRQHTGSGRGIGFARYKNSAAYCAVVVQLTVDPENGRILLEKAFIAADAGQIVNPDGLSNQLEGGLVQAASWTLKEKVRYDEGGVQSKDWYSYPILLFDEVPEIETVLLNRPGAPFLGSGEASMGPTGAAIANAVFDATGVRLRELPLQFSGSK